MNLEKEKVTGSGNQADVKFGKKFLIENKRKCKSFLNEYYSDDEFVLEDTLEKINNLMNINLENLQFVQESMGDSGTIGELLKTGRSSSPDSVKKILENSIEMIATEMEIDEMIEFLKNCKKNNSKMFSILRADIGHVNAKSILSGKYEAKYSLCELQKEFLEKHHKYNPGNEDGKREKLYKTIVPKLKGYKKLRSRLVKMFKKYEDCPKVKIRQIDFLLAFNHSLMTPVFGNSEVRDGLFVEINLFQYDKNFSDYIDKGSWNETKINNIHANLEDLFCSENFPSKSFPIGSLGIGSLYRLEKNGHLTSVVGGLFPTGKELKEAICETDEIFIFLENHHNQEDPFLVVDPKSHKFRDISKDK